MNLGALLQALVQQKGSDLHISSQSVPMIRVRGDMVKIAIPALTAPQVEQILAPILGEAAKAELIRDKNIDFSFKANGIGIFRVNCFYQRHGLGAVFRLLTESPPSIEDLKLPSICKKVCSYSNGLVLVTGPTGSGKSTTLAAMLNYINETVKGHILTLEDPIEFQHESKLCMVNQRALGGHFPTFASAMKAALREDPDVILIGEMRDPETIELALKAAETGHLVFSTLHTNSAAKTVDRIINVFPAEQQPQIRTMLSETLRAVIAQRLIPTSDEKSRMALHDILVNTSAVANMIREGKTFQLVSAMQTGRKDGMQVYEQVLMDAVKRGDIEGRVAWENANDKSMFQAWAPPALETTKTVGNQPANTQAANKNVAPAVRPGTAEKKSA